jgi:beta-glucosidase
MSGEAASRARLDLPGRQSDLVAAITGAGKPVAALLFSGRPLCAPTLFAKADAVVACWFPGTEAGHAIADILTGAAAPSGRLAMTWPRHPGQVPIYFAARSSGRPENPADKYTSKYLDLPNSPEFHFGHGLGYDDFTFNDLSVEVFAEPSLKFTARKEASRAAFAFGDLAVDAGPEVAVRFTVANRSAQPARTTVFLFIRDPVASVARPALELKQFETIRLDAGERRAVNFVLTRRDLSFLDENFQPKFEGGAFEILVGPSADRSGLLSATIEIR